MNKPVAKTKIRCGVYTRKSTEEGLEQEFNSLDAQRESAEAFIKSQAHEGWVHIWVADDGVGMPSEVIAKMFQPFFSTKIGTGGTGLGMSIVENLVKKTLGGTIAVESTLGAGSAFAIRFPRVAPAQSN